jgi:Protein of unknown function (DUF2752)
MNSPWQKHRPLLVMSLAGAALLFFVNPADYGFFPPCLFHRLTGWNCPGCGATRAAHELLRGHWRAAFHDNALLLAALPGLAWFGVRQWREPERRRPVNPLSLWILLAVVVLFGVVRNLAGFEWLSP